MTTEESKVLSIIWNWGGEASVDIIAREAGISINYARLFCESLGKEDYIDFIRSKLCKIKSKGKLAMAGRKAPWGPRPFTGQKGQNLYSESSIRTSRLAKGENRPRKIIVPFGKSGFGLGKNKRGRLLLNY